MSGRWRTLREGPAAPPGSDSNCSPRAPVQVRVPGLRGLAIAVPTACSQTAGRGWTHAVSAADDLCVGPAFAGHEFCSVYMQNLPTLKRPEEVLPLWSVQRPARAVPNVDSSVGPGPRLLRMAGYEAVDV